MMRAVEVEDRLRRRVEPPVRQQLEADHAHQEVRSGLEPREFFEELDEQDRGEPHQDHPQDSARDDDPQLRVRSRPPAFPAGDPTSAMAARIESIAKAMSVSSITRTVDQNLRAETSRGRFFLPHHLFGNRDGNALGDLDLLFRVGELAAGRPLDQAGWPSASEVIVSSTSSWVSKKKCLRATYSRYPPPRSFTIHHRSR